MGEHLEAWQIADFILGGLDEDELESVYRHLDECGECVGWLADVTRVLQGVRILVSPERRSRTLTETAVKLETEKRTSKSVPGIFRIYPSNWTRGRVLEARSSPHRSF